MVQLNGRLELISMERLEIVFCYEGSGTRVPNRVKSHMTMRRLLRRNPTIQSVKLRHHDFHLRNVPAQAGDRGL